MTDYEFTFETDAVGDETERAIMDVLDGFVGGHGATTLVTLTVDGDGAVEAARRAVEDLDKLGVTVERIYPDLVTRKVIAERAGVSTQAVGLWVRGERQTSNVFPAPFTHAGSGLWLWGEVNTWLRLNDLNHDDVEFPSRRETDLVNAWLAGDDRWTGLAVSTAAVSYAPKVDMSSGPLLEVDTRAWIAGTASDLIDYELAS